MRVLFKLHLIPSSTMCRGKYVQESREFPGKVAPHCSQISAQPSWNAESISKACPLFTHISPWPLPPWAEFHHPSWPSWIITASLASIQCPSIQSSGHSTHITAFIHSSTHSLNTYYRTLHCVVSTIRLAAYQ